MSQIQFTINLFGNINELYILNPWEKHMKNKVYKVSYSNVRFFITVL